MAPLPLKETFLSLLPMASSSLQNSLSSFCFFSLIRRLKCSLRMLQRRRQQKERMLALGPSPTMFTVVLGWNRCLIEGNTSLRSSLLFESPQICISWSNSCSISKFWIEFYQQLRPLFIYQNYSNYSYTKHPLFKLYSLLPSMEPPLVQPPILPPIGAPFADIINQQMGRIYQEVEKESVKQKRKVLGMPIGLEIAPLDDSPSQKLSNDTTVKKEGKLTLQSLSAKTIKDGVDDQRVNEENNLDFDLLPGSGQIEIFKILDCLQPFEEIKRIFYEEGKRYKLSMCQNTQNFATIKRNNFGSCKCILKMWSSGDSQATVYQLRSSGNKQKKAKIILVEGEEEEFRKFTLGVMRNLGKRGHVRLTNSQKVEIFCSSNGHAFEEYRKECSKLLSKGRKLSQNTKPQVDRILLRIKQSCEELKVLVRESKEIQFSSSVQTQIEEIFFSQTLIRQLYDQLYVVESDNYRKRREGLLKRYNLFEIFRHLEISEHYSQFRKRRDSQRGSSKSIENIPYMPAIRCLQQMLHINAPSALLEKLLLFHEKIKNCYNDYFLSQMRLGEMEMDDELPVTIFCVLAMQGESSIWGSVKMLETYLKESGGEWQGKAVTGVEAGLQFIGSWDQ